MQSALGNQKYFSKANMIGWLNGQFGAGIKNLEELSSGVVFAKMLIAYNPDSIKFKKVHLEPKTPYDSNQNLRLVEKGFEAAGLKKPFEVEKVSKGNYQTIWEVLQYLRDAFKKAGIQLMEPIMDVPASSVKSQKLKTRKPESEFPSEVKSFASVPRVRKDDLGYEKEIEKLRAQQEAAKKILDESQKDANTKVSELRSLIEKFEEASASNNVRNAIISELAEHKKEQESAQKQRSGKKQEGFLENKENKSASSNKSAEREIDVSKVVNPFASNHKIQYDPEEKSSITKAMGRLNIRDEQTPLSERTVQGETL